MDEKIIWYMKAIFFKYMDSYYGNFFYVYYWDSYTGKVVYLYWKIPLEQSSIYGLKKS